MLTAPTIPTSARATQVHVRTGHLVLAICLSGSVFAACVGRTGSPGQASGSGKGGGTSPSGSGGGIVSSASGGNGAPASGGSSGNVGNGGSAGGAPATGPAPLDSGRTTLRRLNRAEYNNTVRDLLGTSLTPADNFPADDVSDGFDVIGDTLSASPVLIQQLEVAADALVAELFARPASDPVRMRVLPCALATGSETTCATQIMSAFLPRAFRRPTTSTEVASYVALVSSALASGSGIAAAATDGLEAAFEAVLMSPNFMFLVEPDTMPGSAAAVTLTDYELASRLSYFLWSSMPDDTLTAAAQAGGLAKNPSAIQAQVVRMLGDPKAAAFAQNFGAEWLQVDFLDSVTPSTTVFPDYTDAMRTSALQETVLFFQDLVSEDLPLEALLTANFSMLNSTLGKQYGVSVQGTSFVKTSLTGTQRIGLLTQDSLLMGKSYPDRTSPVKRGYFVLSQLLCTPPPPPPANVPALVTTMLPAGTTIRQQLDAHANNPQCSGCHNIMDPIGYALENFNGIGDYRTTDNGSQIDASGNLGSVTFDGATGLANAVATSSQFVPCMTQQMLTYAVGRSFDASDAQAYVAGLGAELVTGGHDSWRGLISAVATSDAFTTRRGEATP